MLPSSPRLSSFLVLVYLSHPRALSPSSVFPLVLFLRAIFAWTCFNIAMLWFFIHVLLVKPHD